MIEMMITKYTIVLPILISFAVAAILSPVFIPLLRKLKFGQNVRDDGPKSHLAKQGTPTMGGIIILFAFTAGTIPYLHKFPMLAPVALTTVGYGIVGFLDDFLKIKKKQSEGLTPLQKMLGQFLVTAGFCVYIYRFSDVGTKMVIPFWNKEVDTGIFFFPLFFFVMLGTVNGSNFTDGLDGLASTVTVIISAFLMIASLLLGTELAPVIGAMIGALLGFLLFNSYKASVFMGDTGSLALGGFVASSAYMLRMPLIIVFVAFIYLIEVLSVIIQVGWYKKTGKRVFKMAPIHHHFEQCGWTETKVVAVFSIVTVILCLIALLGI